MWVTAFLFSFLMTFELLRDLVPFSKKESRFMADAYKWKRFVTLVKNNRNLYKPCVLIARKLFYYESNNCSSHFLVWISFESVSIYNEYWKLNIKLKILLLVVLLYYHKRAMLHFSGVGKTKSKKLTTSSLGWFSS